MVEHYLDTVGVTGSNPVPRTIQPLFDRAQVQLVPIHFLAQKAKAPDRHSAYAAFFNSVVVAALAFASAPCGLGWANTLRAVLNAL